MSVFSDAAAALGVPGWGVAVSSGVLLLAKQVNGSMRPEAKAVIGDFLDHGSLPAQAPSITHAVRAAFLATFGERQFSWRCTWRTLLLSMVTVYSFCLLVWARHGGEIRARMPDLPSLPAMIAHSLLGVAIWSLLLTIWVGKTRLILRGMGNMRGILGLFAFMLLDLVLTYSLNMLLYWGPLLARFGFPALCWTIRSYDSSADCAVFHGPAGVALGVMDVTALMTNNVLFHAGRLSPANILNYAEGVSTLLTSMWTVQIVIAMALLRLLSPLGRIRRLVRWGWDIRANPIMAIGWMIAVLVFLSALVSVVI